MFTEKLAIIRLRLRCIAFKIYYFAKCEQIFDIRRIVGLVIYNHIQDDFSKGNHTVYYC